MSKHTQHVDTSSLAEDARALLSATSDVAGAKVDEARKRLTAALESAKEIAGNVRDRAIAGAKAADETVREHPYKSLAIALGAGAVLGYILAGRCGRKSED